MMVTSDYQQSDAVALLSEEQRLSIELAVAQWMRSPRATSNARARLRNLGVSEEQIEARRRCQSSDSVLRGILRVALALTITRGHLENSDLRHLQAANRAAMLKEITAATAQAFSITLIAEAVERTPYATIDMEVGDY
jgi:uncharacterized protein YciW